MNASSRPHSPVAPPSSPYRRILVPVDGSAAAQRGVVEAIKIARECGAAIRIVHVINRLIDPGFGPALYLDSVVAELRQAGERILSDAADHVRAQKVPVETALIETSAVRVASIIIEEASQWGADLISMGTHGRRGLSRLVLGSDAELVVRSTPVPILLVRESAHGD